MMFVTDHDDEEMRKMREGCRGVAWGVALSVPIWAAIGLIVRRLL